MTKVSIQFLAKNPSIDVPASKSNIDLSDNAKKNSDSGKSSLRPVLYNGRSFRHLNRFLKAMLVSPFDNLAQRITEEFREAIKHEIRKYRWIEKERGRDLSWKEAWNEWTLAHRENLGQFLMTGDEIIFRKAPVITDVTWI
jgi:hypothetical protein